MGPFDLLVPLPADRRGREPERNAWIELHNVVVAAERLDEFGPEDYDRIQRQRRVDFERYLDERIALYRRFLDWTLEDGDFSEANRALLAHVAATLDLASGDLVGTHERAFGNAVHHALADDCLSVDEQLLLYKLQHTLGLDPDLASGAYEVMARQRLLVTVARVLCDGELTPEQAEEVETAQAELGVAVPQRVAEMLDQAAGRWRERHGARPEPPPVPTPEAAASRRHFATTGRWREVNTSRLEAIFGDPDSRDALASGATFHYRVPPVVLRGVRAMGRIDISGDRLVLDARGVAPKAYSRASLARALRFANGVFVEQRGGQALFVESDDDAALHRALERFIDHEPETRRTWAARWRPLYAPERDVALSRVGRRVPEHKRPAAALGKLLRASGWSAIGDAHLDGDTLTLDGKHGQRTVTMRNLRGVHLHRRLVWIDRRGAHDWLLEFVTEEEAQAFVRALL